MKAFRSHWLPMVAVMGIIALVGCSDDDDKDTVVTPTPTVDEFERVAGLGDTYFTEYTTPTGLPVNITADAVWAIQTDGNASNDFYILDWRKAEHFALGHIDGAMNVSLANFEAVVNAIPAGRVVLNVCYTGQSASHATAFMNMMGIDAQNLKFGMCGWTDDSNVTLDKWDNAISDDYGFWLTTVASTATTTYDFPTFDTGKTVAEEILMERAKDYLAAGWKTITIANLYQDMEVNGLGDDYFVINYFNQPLYDAGHIPGAVRYQPKQDFRTDELLNRLPTDKKIVVYCFTGQTSSQVVAYLNAVGYDAYSLLFGVNAICHSNGDICTVPYHVPDTSYPVVTM